MTSSESLCCQFSACRKERGTIMAQIVHDAFATTSTRGLRHDILPMRLYHKAKRLGIWDPRSIDFSQDRLDWQRCTEDEKETLLLQTALFQAAEKIGTLGLCALMMPGGPLGPIADERVLIHPLC